MSHTTTTLAQALQQTRQKLPDCDARMLLQFVLQIAHAHLPAHPQQPLTAAQMQMLQQLVTRRMQGEPVAYLIGRREFYSLDFAVTSAVLIPRPETELLVDLALARIAAGAADDILDLGTGSGAIAITLALQRPLSPVLAVDSSAAALALAATNAQRLGAANVQFLHSDWFSQIGKRQFDCIVSNPPYIAAHDPHLMQGDVRFEPEAALCGGEEGLDCIRHIVRHAPAYLRSGGWLLLEHGYDQADACRELLRQEGYADYFSSPDLAGLMRVSGGRNKSSDGLLAKLASES